VTLLARFACAGRAGIFMAVPKGKFSASRDKHPPLR
jgi:hypothetical protein